MSFLTPWAAVLAAAAAIPLLLLLYFLKLRRQTLRMSSTLLWRRSVEDLEVNAPFQRLRWSLLLLLQLLALLALLAALGEPIMEIQVGPRSDRVILIIDRSASMNARDVAMPGREEPQSRLAAAKDAARQIVARLTSGSRTCQVMIIAAGAASEVISGYESRRPSLTDAIDAIEATDETLNLAGAFQLAGAYAGGDEQAPAPPDVVLLSDGGVGVAPADAGFSLPSGRFRFVQVVPPDAPAANNVGVAAFSARRAFDDPARVQVFVRLVNAGPGPVQTTLTLRADEQIVATRMVDVPAAGAARQANPTDMGPAGEGSTTFELVLPGGAVLRVGHSRPDALPADDVAALVLPPPISPRVVLVHPDDDQPDAFLLDVLEAMEPGSIRTLSKSGYAAWEAASMSGGVMSDLMVFDRVTGLPLPPINSLWIGGVPRGVGVQPPAQPGGRRILSWDRQHPLMRHVALDETVFANFGSLRLSPTIASSPLAFGPDGPVIAALTQRDGRHVIVGFELIRSNWPAQVSLAVFMQNAMDWLTLSGTAEAGLWFRASDPVEVKVATGATRVTIEGIAPLTMEAGGSPTITLPLLRCAGLYGVSGVMPPMDHVAVNVASEVESDIRARDELVVNAQAVRGGGVGVAAPLALWPWLVAAAMALLVVEWLVYCTRRRG